MIRPTLVSSPTATRPLAAVGAPLPLDELVPGDGPWEVELGFGKGRYLLHRAAAAPGRRFLGVEMVSKYERMMVHRARGRGLTNVASLRGEALYLLSAVLPHAFAAAVHVYFPDPWPKARHHKRRLFDPESVDLVLGLLAPGGRFSFATDFLDYGEVVREILAGHPAVRCHEVPDGWPEGPRTNYEAKYVAEGRPILRLEGTLERRAGEPTPLHPAAVAALTTAVPAGGGGRRGEDRDEEGSAASRQARDGRGADGDSTGGEAPGGPGGCGEDRCGAFELPAGETAAWRP